MCLVREVLSVVLCSTFIVLTRLGEWHVHLNVKGRLLFRSRYNGFLFRRDVGWGIKVSWEVDAFRLACSINISKAISICDVMGPRAQNWGKKSNDVSEGDCVEEATRRERLMHASVDGSARWGWIDSLVDIRVVWWGSRTSLVVAICTKWKV